MNPHRLGVLATAVAMLAAGAHATRYLDFFADDGFISLRYARRLAEGFGLTWSAGEAAEGYSNLLWVLAIAGLGTLGLDELLAARLLGMLALFTVIAVICRGDAARAATGGALAVGTGGLAVWAVGGMETTLVAAWVSLAVLGLRRGLSPSSMAMLGAALATTRADGLILVGALTLLGVQPKMRRGALGLVAGGACFALLQELFRLGYHGDWLPNTARAKVVLTPGRILGGLSWVGEAVIDHAPLMFAAGIGVAIGGRGARLLAGSIVVWLTYVALVGGDLFNGHRLFIPIVPLLAILAADGLSTTRSGVIAGLGLAAVHLAWNSSREPIVAQTVPGWALASLEPAEVLRKRYGAADPLLAVDAAGALPYATRFRSVDMLGLNDQWLATHPPENRRLLGHDLGNGAYLWERQPDLIVFCGGQGALEPCFHGGEQLVAHPGWTDRYRSERIDTDGASLIYWVHRSLHATPPHRGAPPTP